MTGRVRRWHVWLVTDVYPPHCGGSGWSTHALACVLRDNGHRVRVFVVNVSRDDIFTRQHDGVEVTEIGVRRARGSVQARLGAADFAHARVAEFLTHCLRTEPEPVDVLHGQHLHSGPPTVAAGRDGGCATVVTVRDYWPVCLHGTSWWAGAVCGGCTPRRLRGCMSEYWGWPQLATAVMVPWASRRLRTRARGLGAADAVVAVSQAVRDRMAAELPGVDFMVVPNIVDPRPPSGITAPTGELGRAAYFLAAGKLQPTKGFDLLLSALRDAPDGFVLKVAGDGPSEPDLKAQADEMGLIVEFLGWVDHDELVALQREATALLLPSAWDEPLSRVVLETMALGTPVVAWARGGNPEMIEAGVSGWLVHDPTDLHLALGELAVPARRDAVGRAARARVAERYSPKAVYPQIVSVYEEAIRTCRDPGEHDAGANRVRP